MEKDKEQSRDKPIQFVVIGCVDYGKSSLCGHLLYKSNYICEREWEKIQQQAETDGMEKWKYARILDIFEEEMQRGKTHQYIAIDFEHNDKQYQLIDTPGHLTFIRSMIEAMSLGAKTACLIVSAQDNEFESGFNRGTLKEHLIIAYTYGIENLIILMNKMDLVDWDQKKYSDKCGQIINFAKRIGYKLPNIKTIPVSAWLGIGITCRTGMPDWYGDECLVEALQLVSTKSTDKPPEKGEEFVGKRLVLECYFMSNEHVYSKGFKCIIHYLGEQHENNDEAFEVQGQLVGIQGALIVKKGERKKTLWELDRQIKTKSNRILFRLANATLGIGKILQVMNK